MYNLLKTFSLFIFQSSPPSVPSPSFLHISFSPFPLSLPSALFPLPLPCSLSCHLPHRVRKPRFSSVLRLEIVVLAFGRNSHSSVKQNPYKCLPVSRQPFACSASLPRPLQPWHSGRTGECESQYMYNVQCIYMYIIDSACLLLCYALYNS